MAAGISMAANKDMITRYKTDLEHILMVNISFVSQCVFEKNLLVSFEYADLKSISRPFEAATELVDRMIFKGETTCTEFLLLLQDAKLTSALPELMKLPWYNHRSTSSTDPTSNYVGSPIQGIPISTQETAGMEH